VHSLFPAVETDSIVRHDGEHVSCYKAVFPEQNNS